MSVLKSFMFYDVNLGLERRSGGGVAKAVRLSFRLASKGQRRAPSRHYNSHSKEDGDIARRRVLRLVNFLEEVYLCRAGEEAVLS